MDVLCRACGGRYHETTEQYDPDKTAHGGMFRLKKKYQAFGWQSFYENAGTGTGDLDCPQCGTPYCTDTRVLTGEPLADHSEKYGYGPPDDTRIKELHAAGKAPGEIAKELGLSHHIVVVTRLRAMGLV